jgi:hypothetical protein
MDVRDPQGVKYLESTDLSYRTTDWRLVLSLTQISEMNSFRFFPTSRPSRRLTLRVPARVPATS